MQKAFKFRIYPNKIQQEFLANHFGASRFVYNYFLNERQTAYAADKTSLNYYDNANSLVKLKQTETYSWLKNVIAQSLQASLKNLETAYQNFFKHRNRFPKFKKRSNKQCFKVLQNFHIENDHLWIPKLKSGIRLRQHRNLEGRPFSCFISKTPTGKYFAAIVCKLEDINSPILNIDKVIGIDLGLTNLLTTSDGEAIANPHCKRNLQSKLAFKQKLFSKKKKGSNNRNKARLQTALINERIANSRYDRLHKLSHRLVSKNQVIITEDLAVANMIKNHSLASSISDASWGELLRQLEYKCRWQEKTFHKVDRFFPSSKTCNGCQFVLESLSLKERSWTCPNCKQHNDRDINAAKNIRDQGLKELKELSGAGTASDIKQKLGQSKDCDEFAKANLFEAFSADNNREVIVKKSRRNKKLTVLCRE